MLTGSEEGDGDGQNEAATAADADTLESIADIEEALEKLGQARNLIKAADTKVNFWPCFFEITSLQISPPPFPPAHHACSPPPYYLLLCKVT